MKQAVHGLLKLDNVSDESTQMSLENTDSEGQRRLPPGESFLQVSVLNYTRRKCLQQHELLFLNFIAISSCMFLNFFGITKCHLQVINSIPNFCVHCFSQTVQTPLTFTKFVK